ncbi:MAG: phosphoglycerate kinase, partial [Desulfovibrio sp.]|nr:phosphoglycerate kinase [Desulfovibrio sp.]
NVGASLDEPDLIPDAKKIMDKAKELGRELPLPVDVVTAKELAPNQKVSVHPVNAVPADEMILDIGPETVKLYEKILGKAATVVWNGPVGAFETEPFGKGTKELAEFLAKSGAFVVVGGGDSVAAVESYGLADKMGYISTGGGASLELLEGKILPSVKALQDRGEK